VGRLNFTMAEPGRGFLISIVAAEQFTVAHPLSP
jgi:hypothetical protein